MLRLYFLYCNCIFFLSAGYGQHELRLGEATPFFYRIEKKVTIGNYFDFMDSLLNELQLQLNYPIDEQMIARANPDLVQKFVNTDYYRWKNRTRTSIYDNRTLVILQPGDYLLIPSREMAEQFAALQATVQLDINLPEFLLRIIENGEVVHQMPIRIGQNRQRFLQSVGKTIDLRTRTGFGKIEFVHLLEHHIDPVTGETFSLTRRDDGATTRMPLIPWLEPRIDGLLRGQWIHPTTNPKTLRKTYSNGCIATSEADAWLLYFYAPVGTPVLIRYDLEVPDGNGGTIVLDDIYYREPTFFIPMQPESAPDER